MVALGPQWILSDEVFIHFAIFSSGRVRFFSLGSRFSCIVDENDDALKSKTFVRKGFGKITYSGVLLESSDAIFWTDTITCKHDTKI